MTSRTGGEEDDLAGSIEQATSAIRLHPADATIAMAYHADPDGVAAACLSTTAFERMRRSISHSLPVPTSEFDFSRLVRDLRQLRPHVVLTLDLNLYSRLGTVEDIARLAEHVMIYDDHVPPEVTATPGNVDLINPTLRHSRTNAPACWFAHTLLGEVGGENRATRWICAAGLQADRALDLIDVEEWIAPAERRDLTRIVRAISAAYAPFAFGREPDPVLVALRDAVAADADLLAFESGPGADLLAEATRVRREMDGEIRRLARAIAGSAGSEQGPVTVFHDRFSSPFRIANLVASEARAKLQRHPAMVVACQQLDDGTTMAELRLDNAAARRGIDLALLLEAVDRRTTLINHGGHPPAAGCRFPTSHTDEFLGSLEACLEAST